MNRNDAPDMIYVVFDAEGIIVESTRNENKAYQEEPSDGRVVTYTKA